MYLGLPSIIGMHCVERALEIPLDETQTRAIHRSAEILGQTLAGTGPFPLAAPRGRPERATCGALARRQPSWQLPIRNEHRSTGNALLPLACRGRWVRLTAPAEGWLECDPKGLHCTVFSATMESRKRR